MGGAEGEGEGGEGEASRLAGACAVFEVRMLDLWPRGAGDGDLCGGGVGDLSGLTGAGEREWELLGDLGQSRLR